MASEEKMQPSRLDEAPVDAQNQVTPKIPTTRPDNNLTQVAAGKALTEKTKQACEAQKEATQAAVDVGLVPPLKQPAPPHKISLPPPAKTLYQTTSLTQTTIFDLKIKISLTYSPCLTTSS